MGAVRAWARSELRRRTAASVALALLIALSGAVVLTAAAGAPRTASAFDRFLKASATADVQMQYVSDDDIDDQVLAAVRASPDVAAVAPVYITVAMSEASDYDLGIFSSPSPELLHDVDRGRLLDGRLPDPGAADEIVANRFTLDSLGLEVGDTMQVGTFSPEQLRAERYDSQEGPTISLRVVGVVLMPYDLADEAFVAMFATPAFHKAYGDLAGGYGPTLEIATQGPRPPAEVVQEAISDFDFEELELITSEAIAKQVEDGTRVLAIGLSAFAAVAALSALVACGQALNRRLTEAMRDQPALCAMGLSRTERVVAMLLLLTPVVSTGVVLAVLAAVPASMLMPIGAARLAEPNSGMSIDVLVLGVGGIALFLALIGISAIGAWRIAGRSSALSVSPPTARRSAAPGRLLRASLRPPAHLGVTMALDPGRGRSAIPVRSAIIGATVGAAGVVAVLTFGASLDRLVQEPDRSGWNWTFSPDLYVEDGQLAQLLEVPGLEDAGTLVLRRLVVDGEQVQGMAMRPEKGDPSLTVLRGRMPVSTEEIALGPKLADRSGAGVGDPIDVVDAQGTTRSLVVVGEVLFPTIDGNPFNDGAAVAPSAIDDLAHSDGFEQVVVTFRDSLTQADAARRVRAELPDSLSIYSFPSLPPDVANLEGVRFLPIYLGGFLALLALGAVGHALATSVRRRRRDLGVVRSLGFLAADVGRTISAQSATLVAVGLCIGAPLGILLGRVTWRLVAERIGVAASPTIPLIPLVAILLAGMLASLALATLPGRSAARLRPVDALRSE